MQSFTNIENELFVEQLRGIITEVVERKLEELHERDTSPYINGIDGLAKYLNIGTTLAQELKNEKAIASYQRGRTVWFKKSEVDRFVNQNKN